MKWGKDDFRKWRSRMTNFVNFNRMSVLMKIQVWQVTLVLRYGLATNRPQAYILVNIMNIVIVIVKSVPWFSGGIYDWLIGI